MFGLHVRFLTLMGKALTTSAPLVSDPHSMAIFAAVNQELTESVQLGSFKKPHLSQAV